MLSSPNAKNLLILLSLLPDGLSEVDMLSRDALDIPNKYPTMQGSPYPDIFGVHRPRAPEGIEPHSPIHQGCPPTAA
jgi:hypothetical protein